MRKRLYREDHPTTDGRLVRHTTWREEPLPLLCSADLADHDGSRLIGTVTGIDRGEDGWVYGDLQTEEDTSGLACEADFDSIATVMEGDVMVMVAPRLIAVTLGTNPTWEGTF